MEAENKIQLITSTSFEIPQDELQRFYTTLALLQLRSLKNPDYDEQIMLKMLYKDMNFFLSESQALTKQFPNNLNINKIFKFFDMHHTQLKRILDQFKK